jgi:hypothetical protein
MSGLHVERHVVSKQTGRQFLTVVMVGYPDAATMCALHDMGWQIEVQPIPSNRFRDCVAYIVTFIDIPGMTVRFPN